MKRFLIAGLFALITASSAVAQSVPFRDYFPTYIATQPAAVLPLNNADTLIVLQGGVVKQVSHNAFIPTNVNGISFPAAPAAAGTVPFLSALNTISYGTAPVTGGGTGQTTFTANLPLIGNGAAAIAQGTRSGDTTQFATSAGPFVGCAQWDGTGNIGSTGVNCGVLGATAPGNPGSSIQYNNGGAFAGSARLLWDNANATITLTTATADVSTWGKTGLTVANFDGSTGLATVIGWSGTAGFSFDFGTLTVACGNSLPHDRSCFFRAGTLDANTQINLPDGGSFVTAGTAVNQMRNGLEILSAGGNGNTPPAGFVQGSGAIWMGDHRGKNGMILQAIGSNGITCYGGSGGSPGCASWGLNLVNEDGWQIAGIQQGGIGVSWLGIGALRASRDATLHVGGPFDEGVAQMMFTDTVVSGGIAGPGTAFTITGGAGYTPGTYNGVLLAAAGAGQYTRQVFTNIVVGAGGAVTNVTVIAPDVNNQGQLTGYGVGLHVGDTLTTPNVNLGGVGGGFFITVTGIMNGRAAPMLLGNLPGSTVIWGIGPNSSVPTDTNRDITLRLGSTEINDYPWYNTDRVHLILGASLKLGTQTGVNVFPFPPDGNLTCGESLTDSAGTLAIRVCDPVGSFAGIGAGSGGGTGYTPGSYTNVAMAPEWGDGSTCIGVTANIVVGAGGNITSYAVNAPGTGCQTVERLLPDTGVVGAGTGAYAGIQTLATIPSPISVSYLKPGTIYSAAGTALPSCAAGTNGAIAVVSDALGPTFRGAYTSGGGAQTIVLCVSGTGWITP